MSWTERKRNFKLHVGSTNCFYNDLRVIKSMACCSKRVFKVTLRCRHEVEVSYKTVDADGVCACKFRAPFSFTYAKICAMETVLGCFFLW